MSLRRNALGLLFIVGILLNPVNVFAIELEGLYSTSIVVVSRDDERERKRAFSSAMQEVLLRVSGTEEVLRSNSIRGAVNNPEPYVESYVHRSIETPALDGVFQTEETGVLPDEIIELTISFFESEIQSLLDENNFPVWPANRPETLVWLVVQEELGEREVLNSGSNLSREMMALIQLTASKRGLPLLFPLMDLEDQQALSADELWNLDEAKIMAASQRYQTESILVIRLYQSLTGETLGKSLYLFRERSLAYDSFEEPVDIFITKATSLAAEELSGNYSILLSGGSGEAKVSLTVEGIQTAKDYAGLLNYVGNLTDVNAYQIISVKRGSILLELSTGGQLRQLVETIALGENLESVVELNRDTDGVYMYYRWVQ